MSNIINNSASALKKVSAFTEKPGDQYHQTTVAKTISGVSSIARDAYDIGTGGLMFALSKAWIVAGMVNPARTTEDGRLLEFFKRQINSQNPFDEQNLENQEPFKDIDRFDAGKLWSIQMGDYYLPLSQTYTLRAKKKVNVASLVDGIDIIQQTQKEAKQIDCVLRIAFNDHQKNLNLVDENNKILGLASFLSDLYENDSVFTIINNKINNGFGVTHVIMTEYNFIPKAGLGTFTLEFSLMEVKYGDNVLTFDLTQVSDSDRQIGGGE